MDDLIIFLIAASIGYFVGSRLRGTTRITRWTSVVQTAAILILIFVMGLRMGANEEVTENLASIGLISVVLTIAVMLFAMAAAALCRKMIGMDRFARLESMPAEPISSEERSEKKKGSMQTVMSVGIILSVVSGMLLGCFLVPDLLRGKLTEFDHLAGNVVNAGLIVLLFLIGVNIGYDGTVIENFKKVGLRIMIFPVVIILVSLGGTALCAPILGISVREALAVCAGFGWYSVAPGIILEEGLAHCAAISFLHCIMREYLSVLTVPFIAKKIGYMEAIGAAGGTAMRVCLPVIERSTRGDVAIYSFICGFVHTISVPVLVPLFAG